MLGITVKQPSANFTNWSPVKKPVNNPTTAANGMAIITTAIAVEIRPSPFCTLLLSGFTEVFLFVLWEAFLANKFLIKVSFSDEGNFNLRTIILPSTVSL